MFEEGGSSPQKISHNFKKGAEPLNFTHKSQLSRALLYSESIFIFHFKIVYPGYKFSINILFYNWPCKKLLTKLEKKLYTKKFTIKGAEYAKVKDVKIYSDTPPYIPLTGADFRFSLGVPVIGSILYSYYNIYQPNMLTTRKKLQV